MTTLRSLAIAVAVVGGLAATASTASAQHCQGGNCHAYPKYYTFGAFAFGNKTPLPAYQAAPWYLYWPYDGHFLTPAPVTGAFYGPPNTGNFPTNPYFPGPAYGQGYGPIPGSPPPRP